jgi:hypothetical protein
MAEHVISLLIIADDDATEVIMNAVRNLVGVLISGSGEHLRELTLKLDTGVQVLVGGSEK